MSAEKAAILLMGFIARIEAIYAEAEERGFEAETMARIIESRREAAALLEPQFTIDDLRLCESPIEEQMMRAMYDAKWPDNYNPKIYPQMKVDPYRIDFLVTDHNEQHSEAIVVECDGHDFHERTKEQAARDRSRDRFFTLAGFKVLRFTGSEIHRDAAKCAEQVVEMARATVPTE
jgi:very-short-patch-repair endonuclease